MNMFVRPLRQVRSMVLRTASYKTINQPVPLFDGVRFFSSAAAVENSTISSATDTKKKRRRRIDPLIVTENAASRIKELLSGESAEGSLGIRLGVKRRGCNGLSYTLNYVFEPPQNDEEMEAHGVKVFIDPMAMFSVVGTVMDYEETDLASEFTFNNPNSKGDCGCGESFNV